jgi:hypothetical protein
MLPQLEIFRIWRFLNSFLYKTTQSVYVFQQQYVMVSMSAITIGTNLLHVFLTWTLHSSINSYVWSHYAIICEYVGCLYSFLYPPHSQFLSSNSNRWWYSHVPSNLLHFLPAPTLHSSSNSYVWSHNEIVSEYGGFWIVSDSHHTVSLCLPRAICYGIYVGNHYWHKSITCLSSLDTSLIY